MDNCMSRFYRGPLVKPIVVAALALLGWAGARAQAPEWEGAVGLLVNSTPIFMGADQRKLGLSPGFYLRWGRLSVTNASGFRTRANDEVVRGLGIDLGNSEHFKLSLGLRFDGGRRESTSDHLQGLGSVKSTVRVRLGLRYSLDDHWQANAAWSVDALGRGGGNFGDVSLQREQRWSPETTWTAGTAVSLAGDRYLQTWFGVSREQSLSSGYPVYEPHAGWRDATLYANLRSQLTPRWVLLGGVSATRLLGPAADSPLVRQASGIAVNAGLAYSF